MKNSKHISNQFQDKASMWRGLYIMYNCTKCKVVMDELQLVIPPDISMYVFPIIKKALPMEFLKTKHIAHT